MNPITKPIWCPLWHRFASQLPPLSLSEGPWVAGGAARRLWGSWEKTKWGGADVDVFFASESQFRQWEKLFLRAFDLEEIDSSGLSEFRLRSNYKSMSTPNADTYTVMFHDVAIAVQLITKAFYPTLVDLWNIFDFNVSCFAADQTQVCCLPTAEQGLVTRTLAINNATVKHNLSLRLLKHVIQGYQAPNSMILEAADQIARGEVDWRSPY